MSKFSGMNVRSLITELYARALSKDCQYYIKSVEITDGGSYLNIGDNRLKLEDFSNNQDLGALNPLISYMGFKAEELDGIIANLHIQLGNSIIDLLNGTIQIVVGD
jgi:hypothetical protein